MIESETEFWKKVPGIPFMEGSSYGNVRTLDRVVTTKSGTRVIKGRILKQQQHSNGYLCVGFGKNGKKIDRLVHRLIAKAFIPNPNNYPEINHRDNNPLNNSVDNLEWITHECNIEYREKYGKSATEVSGRPVLVINLRTLKVSRFRSQHEAGRALGVSDRNINSVIKGRRKTAGGYWFVEDDGSDMKIDEGKLRKIAADMLFKGKIYAINLETQEVLRFDSQSEASRKLEIDVSQINAVLKNRQKTAHGFWFITNNSHTIENTTTKFGSKVANKVAKIMEEK